MVDNFSIRKHLGSGRTSEVYVCDHSLLKVPVAVKLINKGCLNEKQLSNIRREIMLMNDIDHPNIISLFGVLETEEKVALIMEYAPNGTLQAAIKQGESMDENTIRKYFIQILEAVDYLHNEKHIIHRDIKPENILLDYYGRVKLADFGLSIQGENLRNTSCGSPCFCSPEILKKSSYGPETDIWSLGIVLYFLATSYLPFKDSNMPSLFQKILKHSVTFSDTSISIELQDLILKMLDKNPNNRITIKQIKEHHWTHYHEVLPYLTPLKTDMNDEKISHRIYASLEELGYSKKMVDDLIDSENTDLKIMINILKWKFSLKKRTSSGLSIQSLPNLVSLFSSIEGKCKIFRRRPLQKSGNAIPKLIK
ncbi:CAMK family protein kinase [Tritrichomonas foetus]|uniref:CAMK family protein kinase n=1 Tax=Tritrichomonas foetus TaxID=1144522 RepID=A0A1J4JEA5_9EUKA|nr:CAMK family protein kinase [Tritrichomonas foetus]|eukprot:OHS97490.1 CAMK family protein kinase [Tritrichomonas foetus]